MNLHRLLQQRAAAGRPVRVGLIGAGKFGSMFLNQVPTMAGLEVSVIADLDPERARAACRKVGWDARRDRAHAVCRLGRRVVRRSRDRSRRRGDRLARRPASPMPARRSPPASTSSWSMSRPTCSPARCWPRRRGRKGVVYSLAYGDQPALTCELVDWARACGFEVAAAGKGTKYLPAYHAVTPDEVWGHYGLTPEEAQARRHEPANVQLVSRRHQIGDRDGGDRQCDRPRRARQTGSAFRPAASTTCRMCCAAAKRAARWSMTAWSRWSRAWSATAGRCSAICAGASTSSLKAPNEYARTCFQGIRPQDRRERLVRRDVQALPPDRAGARHFGVVGGLARRADRPAAGVARRCRRRRQARRCDAGETLDGEGGYTVWGKLVPAERSLAEGALPIGLAHKVPLRRDIAAGEIVRWADVDDPDSEARRRCAATWSGALRRGLPQSRRNRERAR